MNQRRGLIAAINSEGVIGVDNRIPWDCPADMKRFRHLTTGGTVIMGRRTFESIGRCLPKRTNIVVSSQFAPMGGDPFYVNDLDSALRLAGSDVWFIGGTGIYREALERGLVDVMELTWLLDENSTGDNAVHFPLTYDEVTAGWRAVATQELEPNVKAVRYVPKKS